MKKIFSNIRNIIILALLARMFFLLFFADLDTSNYWEYGTLAKNVFNGNGYSYYYFDAQGVVHEDFSEKFKPLASAYMPPGYVVFLMPYLTIQNDLVRNIALFSSKIIISLIVLFFLFKLTKLVFNEEVAIVSSLIYCFYPEFIYSCFTIGPTVFYHLFVVLIFYLITKDDKYSKVNILKLGLLLSIAVYFRPEILFFFLMAAIYLIVKARKTQILIPIFIAMISISPWLIRNYVVFDKFPVITTNFGQNFYRGNNAYYPGVWADKEVDSLIKELPKTTDYEIKKSELFQNHTLEFIKDNPGKELLNISEKLVHLWLINYYDSRSLNPIYIISWSIILILFIYGFYKIKRSQYRAITTIFLIYHSVLAVVFIGLLRYQTMMKIALIPIAAYGLIELIKKFKQERTT